MAITTLEEYLREFSVEIGDRILTSFPALHAPGDPVSPILGKLLRKPFAAQEVAIAGAVARLRQANSVACIAEMGTGKTLMAMSIAHVFAAGRPYGCLFVVPPQLLQKTAREILQTIPGARVYVIDSLRSQRPGQAGPHGVNEFRLRNGRIIRDGVHTTLTEMRLRGKHKSAWDRWVAEHGPGPHYVICGRDRAKLGAFWRPSFQVARCGNHNGAIVNPDSGRPIVFDDERLLRDDFDRQERFAETLESVALCGGEKTKPRRPLYSPLWQVDGSRIRRYAPIEFIGRYLPHFFKFGIADEVHEAKAADTAQGNALGTLAAAVDKMIVLTGTLTGGMASDVFNVLYRIDPKMMVSQGYEYGEAGIRSFTETYGVLETITTIEPQENACSKAKITRRVKERPGASPLLFARFLMDLGAFVSLEDISANLPPYTEEVISVPMDKPLAEAYEQLEQDIAAALQEHRGNSSVISTALNALLLYPDRPFSMGQLWGVAYDEETKRRERFLIADPPDLDESVVYTKERRLVELVQSEVQNRRGVQVYATYTQKRDVTRRIESILSSAGIKAAVLTTQTPPEEREAWYERQLKAGVQVFIAHPRLVQTGLDYVEYGGCRGSFFLKQVIRFPRRVRLRPSLAFGLCGSRSPHGLPASRSEREQLREPARLLLRSGLVERRRPPAASCRRRRSVTCARRGEPRGNMPHRNTQTAHDGKIPCLQIFPGRAVCAIRNGGASDSAACARLRVRQRHCRDRRSRRRTIERAQSLPRGHRILPQHLLA